MPAPIGKGSFLGPHIEKAFREFVERREARKMTPELLRHLKGHYWSDTDVLVRQSGVEERFRSVDLCNLDPRLPSGYRAMAAVLLRMLESPAFIAIGGERGTGKTAMACGAAIAFCRCNRPALYRRIHTFFKELKGTWGDNATESEDAVWQRHQRPELLILDELQVRYDTDAEHVALTTLIDLRYAAQKSTVLLSNLLPERLKESLGPSIWRRLIEEGGVYEANWPRIQPLLEGEAA